MVTILMMSAKMDTVDLKINVFWYKGYEVIISIQDVTNKRLSRDSNYIADVVTRPKFGNWSISMREVIITSFYKDLTSKITFFEGWPWFKFGLTLVVILKFYTSVAKGLNIRVRKFCRLILTFVEVIGEQPFCPRPHPE